MKKSLEEKTEEKEREKAKRLSFARELNGVDCLEESSYVEMGEIDPGAPYKSPFFEDISKKDLILEGRGPILRYCKLTGDYSFNNLWKCLLGDKLKLTKYQWERYHIRNILEQASDPKNDSLICENEF